MINTLKIIFIPLDNRPVSYTLPEQTAGINKKIDFIIPPRRYLGGLVDNTDVDSILDWLDIALNTENIDYIVISLDTIAYGGLIPSRRSDESTVKILDRINKLRNIFEKNKTNAKILAFSSIMRISDSYVNEEEKLYWDIYGRELFKYSFFAHKDGKEPEELKKRIPKEILEDYLQTRQRNFLVNKHYLSLLEDGFFDYLVFSKDDTGQYGLNVIEAQEIEHEIKEKNLHEKAQIITGADEIPTDLVCRAIVQYFEQNIKIFPVFSTENGKNVVSRYEDKTIGEAVNAQILLCGGQIANSKENADMFILVHTPENTQNDHCLQIYPESENPSAIDFCLNFIQNAGKPDIIADISHANGADNLLVSRLLEFSFNISNIYAYAGWNTTGNTLGTAISTGISKYIAEKIINFNEINFKKALLTRFADDWLYQTIIRQKLRAKSNIADKEALKELMFPLVLKISSLLEYDIHYEELVLNFPWNRTFEVEINF